MPLHITDDTAADALLSENPLALLTGMLLDQQIAMETAFTGPLKIRDRIGSVDAATIAGYDPDAFAEAFKTPPAVRSEEHTSELQSLMRISYAVFCLTKKNKLTQIH